MLKQMSEYDIRSNLVGSATCIRDRSTLKDITEGIYAACADAAENYGMKGDIQAGANIAGFLKVADAMLWQGVV